jgi:hypothetical protein
MVEGWMTADAISWSPQGHGHFVGCPLKAPSMQPGCSSVNTLTQMKSDQIEVSFLGRSS